MCVITWTIGPLLLLHETTHCCGSDKPNDNVHKRSMFAAEGTTVVLTPLSFMQTKTTE